MCVNNFPKVARGAEWLRLEPATSQLQGRRPNHYATTPLLSKLFKKIKLAWWDNGIG